jgi:hypothetical protein
LRELVRANKGKRGFTYTHKPVLGTSPVAISNRAGVADANRNGFTVNLSANSLAHADALLALKVGPVATILPATQLTNTHTPKGRKVIVCPAITHNNVTCSTCKLCSIVNREAVIGFPVHGATSKRAALAMQRQY